MTPKSISVISVTVYIGTLTHTQTNINHKLRERTLSLHLRPHAVTVHMRHAIVPVVVRGTNGDSPHPPARESGFAHGTDGLMD